LFGNENGKKNGFRICPRIFSVLPGGFSGGHVAVARGGFGALPGSGRDYWGF
jgi:hypothetical protein